VGAIVIVIVCSWINDYLCISAYHY